MPSAPSFSDWKRLSVLYMLALGAVLVPSCVPERDREAVPTETAALAAPRQRRLTRGMLDQSIALALQYLMNSQTPRGNFVYEYDFVENTVADGDNEVRQAGALWSLALAHQDGPSEATARATMRGLEFFKSNSALTPDGRRYVAYPGAAFGKTGAVALVSLALVEFLRARYYVPSREDYERDLGEYILFLRSLRMDDGHFCGRYDQKHAVPSGGPSPYSDGEVLLLLVKAAKYAGHAELRGLALQSAERMYWDYLEPPLAEAPHSGVARAFYQWGSMAFYELYTTGWPGVEKYGRRAVEMALSTIEAERLLSGGRITASTIEGLAAAWEMARLTGRRDAMEKIGRAIDLGLAGLISRQVGGPAPNEYLRSHPAIGWLAVGGVMSGPSDPVLRIDATSHHLNAMILARRLIYRE